MRYAGLGIRELVSDDDAAPAEVIDGTSAISEGSIEEKSPVESTERQHHSWIHWCIRGYSILWTHSRC